MNILLTWSGSASHDIAAFFRTWLQMVLPGIQPWISDEDIAKGKKWTEELTVQLSRTNVSITFVTPENVHSPWVFYEVGFIAAKLDNGVCPYLIGVEGKQVQDTPLGQWQWTEASKDDTWKLIRSINQRLGDQGQTQPVLEGNYNDKWPRLKRQLDKVLATMKPVSKPVIETELSIEEQLSPDARQLLVEAAEDENGTICCLTSFEGTSVTTNRQEFNSGGDARTTAKWKAALGELVDHRLVKDVEYEGTMFELTKPGYDVADLIKSRTT